MSKVEIPSPPKRPTNAFFKFRAQVYDDVKNKNPTLKITELTKVIGEMFRAMDEKKKKSLEDLFAKELGVYKEKKDQYDAKYGALIKKDKKKAKKSAVSDTEEPSEKKKKDKPKKVEEADKKKDDKKDKKVDAKKESKPDKEKKLSKGDGEAKKANKKK